MIEKLPKYLSPSSIAQAKNSPNTFFCQRLIFDAMPKEPQGLAPGVGTAFDISIKKKLIELHNVPTANTIEQIESSLNPDVAVESYIASDLLMKTYFLSRLASRTNWVQVEGDFNMEYTFTVKGKTTTVPLMCKLDAIVQDEQTGMLVPLDWKCSGYTSASGATPEQGYMDKFDGVKWCGPHKNYYPEMSVREIDNDWGRQFTLYAMCVNFHNGITELVDTPVIIHHPVFNGKNKKPMVATYRAIATVADQEHYWTELSDLWEDLHSGVFCDKLAVPYILPEELGGKGLTISVLSSYAWSCETFFSNNATDSAHKLWLESRMK